MYTVNYARSVTSYEREVVVGSQAIHPMNSAHFGIEIEVIAEPLTIRHSFTAYDYWEKLAKALKIRGYAAKLDYEREYRNGPEKFDRWLITRDGSLNGHADNQVAFEAVSPIFHSSERWAEDIDAFWDAMSVVFERPIKSTKCGSHIHVSPGLVMSNGTPAHYSLEQLKTIAYGVLFYEPLVRKSLPAERKANIYCRRNSDSSIYLSSRNRSFRSVRRELLSARCAEDIVDIVQSDRRVVWNFKNTLPGRSGTIEFRGGRGLRGRIRTKWWIAFATSFIHFVLKQNDLRWHIHDDDFWLPSIDGFYENVRRSAGEIGMRSYLPPDYRVLNESRPR